MQTVYLLKNCPKSYNALKNLYNYPDLSTNIIILDNNQAKILLLDKRVKKFPFIINTLPTNIGLIPRLAKVLPLEMFMMLKKFDNNKSIKNPRVCENRTVSIPSSSVSVKNLQFKTNHKYQHKNTNKIYKPLRSKINPVIKTVKETDGSINIILNK